MTNESVVKITVTIEKRDDGGLYVYSNELPGFVLSHKNPRLVFKDIELALSVFLSKKLDRQLSHWLDSEKPSNRMASLIRCQVRP
jgi:hypothetical protein